MNRLKEAVMVQRDVRYFSGPVPLLLLAAVILASFLASSGPIQWMDNGMFLADATTGHFFAQSLGPLDHPLYQFFSTGLYQLFHSSQLLSLMNSMLLIPIAGSIYWLSRSVGATRNLALLAAAATITAHAVFWISTKAEVYIFHMLFVLLAYAVGFDQRLKMGDYTRLALIGLLTGMAGSVHQLTFIVLLPLYAHLLLQYRLRTLMTIPAFAVGFFSAYPGILNDLQAGMNLEQIFRHYLTGAAPNKVDVNWEGSMFRFDEMWHEKNSVMILLLSLMGPQLLGLVIMPKDSKQRILWAALLLNCLFALPYNVTDRFTFFLPGVAFAAILGVMRFKELLPQSRGGASLLNLSVFTCPAALLLAWVAYDAGVVKLPVHTEALPYRNDIHYFMVPYLRDRSAQQFVEQYEVTAPAGAMIVSDWTPSGALRSAQAAGRLQGRTLVSCETNDDMSGYVHGAGAFLPRTSYCEKVLAKYALDKREVGFQLQDKDKPVVVQVP
jgi:hypothetical protein